MKIRTRILKAAAALMIAVFAFAGAGVPGNTNYEINEDNLIIKKSSMGLTESAEKIIYAFDKSLDVGPGAKLFNGGKLTLLTNQAASQMMSVVIETGKGGVIVIDGGTADDAGHLLETIRSKGGKVNAWLITHPHSDHVGAFNNIINNPDSQITVDNVYYSFNEQEWYDTNESYRADMVAQTREALTKLPAEALHPDIKKGQEIWVDDVKITVLNEPYWFSNNAINNSSVAFQVMMNNKAIVFLGDMGVEAGQSFLKDYDGQNIQCDILQMSHHGQNGVEKVVYEKLRPSICLWPTPDWLWNNDNGGGENSGPWATILTRQWMQELGVRANYCIKDGDQIIE